MSSKTRSGPGEHARAIGGEARDLAGKIRRMAITLTSRSFWQVVGHRLLDGSTETRDVEIFSGVGFYARPPADGKPEAMVAFQEGGANPVIIAVRDEKTRRAVAGAIGANESIMYNTVAVVLIKAGGTVEIRTANGVAGPLVTQEQFMNHTHATAGTGPPTPPTAIAPLPTLTGTTVLKAE